MVRKALRKYTKVDSNGSLTIEHGDFVLNLDDRSADIMIDIVKLFNYRIIEELQKIMVLAGDYMYSKRRDDIAKIVE